MCAQYCSAVVGGGLTLKTLNCLPALTLCGCSQEEHDASVKFTFPMFSKPMTHTEFLEKLA